MSDISRSNYISNEVSEKPKIPPMPLQLGAVDTGNDTDDIYEDDEDKDEEGAEPKMIYYSEEPDSALNKKVPPIRPTKKPLSKEKEMSTGTKLKIKRKEKLREAAASTGSIRSTKKQKFRFRFEPNKSSLTKIVLKDSHSASETPSINSTLMSQNKLKACGILNDDEEQVCQPKDPQVVMQPSGVPEFKSAIPRLIPLNSSNPAIRKNTLTRK